MPAPWGTFAVNVAGTFVLGYVITLLQERMPLTAYGHGLVTSELVPTTL